MQNFISYMVIPEKEVILGYVSGKITWRDVIEYKNSLTFDKNYDPGYNIIDDIRDVKIIVNSNSEVNDFIEFASKNNTFLGSRKSAVLTNTPNQVVNSELLSALKKDLPINFKTFSTLPAAIKWIGISPEDQKLVESKFEELKNQPDNIFIQ